MRRREIFQIIFQIITKMTEQPSFTGGKLLQMRKKSPAREIEPVPHSGCHEAFLRMGFNLVLVIIQKRKSVELLYPVQHFFLCLPEIIYRKYGVIQSNMLGERR